MLALLIPPDGNTRLNNVPESTAAVDLLDHILRVFSQALGDLGRQLVDVDVSHVTTPQTQRPRRLHTLPCPLVSYPLLSHLR